MTTVAILQPNYIPWKGYFDLINQADNFVLYDDVQYTKNDWRNRNKIKTPNGTQWLTIGVKQESLSQTIKETTVANQIWAKKHWKTIKQNYSKANYFSQYAETFEDLYHNLQSEKYLSEINYRFIVAICELLGIKSQIHRSSEMGTKSDGQNERLIEICQQLDAESYLSGPAAKSYLDETLFQQNRINVEWMNYSNYPNYTQLYPPFVHEVSILDLLFNHGDSSQSYFSANAL